jgi:adenosine deaminase
MSWYPRMATDKLSFYKGFPKVELHRHLEGSLRINTLMEVAKQHNIRVSEANFHSLVQIQQNDPLTFSNFLSKFATLRLFFHSPEVIHRITKEAIADAAADGVVYMEMRFTPVALTRSQGFSFSEVMDWVCQATMEASRQYGIMVRLIASVNRNESVDMAEEVAQLAIERREKGIIGLDLAGNEAEFSSKPFIGVMRAACQNGMHMTIHGGEWGPAENVRLAIEEFDTERVGHGVRVMEYPAVVDLARERGTVFEVCMTSNYQSGVVKTLKDHPFVSMMKAGLNVTINTDDPSISGITLSDEYRLAMETMGLSPQQLSERVLAAAQASFLPPAEKQDLVTRLDNEIKNFLTEVE